jgi:3-deoxy-manno-octulosonate cytidylyltransferase (CMP-KDO synthetase)
MLPILLIPARLAAQRLPNKPLADIHGKPMIQHVWERAVAADVGPVAVACGDREIVDVIRALGGTAILTDPSLPTGSDRVWAALQALDPAGKHDVVINVQGDLPTLDPAHIRALLPPLENPEVDITTPACPMDDPADIANPNIVRPVVARDGRALYFSRGVAPYGDGPYYHHIGLYAYRRDALARFVSLPPSPLEKRERLEQLRAMEDGMRIDVVFVDAPPISVDTPEDLERARAFMA